MNFESFFTLTILWRQVPMCAAKVKQCYWHIQKMGNVCTSSMSLELLTDAVIFAAM